MHATQQQENIWQYEGQIWNQLEKLQLEVSVWPYFYSFLDYHSIDAPNTNFCKNLPLET